MVSYKKCPSIGKLYEFVYSKMILINLLSVTYHLDKNWEIINI